MPTDKNYQTVIAILVALAGIIGGWLYADERWNQKADIETLARSVGDLKDTMGTSINELRRVFTANSHENKC